MARARAGAARAAGAGAAAAALAALALALAAGVIAAGAPAAAEGCALLKKRACKKSPTCKWGGSGWTGSNSLRPASGPGPVDCLWPRSIEPLKCENPSCVVAKDACDAVQGRKMRRKCRRVSAMPCQCSLNSQKKRGKCGACARFDESLVGPPSRPEPTRTNGCARGVDPGIQNWMAIASSSDGAKLAAGVWEGHIWTSCDSGLSWTERSVGGAPKLWLDIASSSDGTKLAAVESATQNCPSCVPGECFNITAGEYQPGECRGSVWECMGPIGPSEPCGLGTIWTSEDSGQSWTERSVGAKKPWKRIVSSSDGTKLAATQQPGRSPFGRSSGTVWTSADSGQSWTERPVGAFDSSATAGLERDGAPWPGEGVTDIGDIASSSDGTKLAVIARSQTVTGLRYVGDALGYPRDMWLDHMWRKVWNVEKSDSIWTSTDSGQTWMQRTAGEAPNNIGDIVSSSDGTKLALESDGLLWTSTDSGESWTERSLGKPVRWVRAVSNSDGTKLAALGGFGPGGLGAGVVWTSSDSGQSWTERSVDRRDDFGSLSREWTAIASSSDGAKLVAVARSCRPSDLWMNWDWDELGLGLSPECTHVGRIWTSKDMGKSWRMPR